MLFTIAEVLILPPLSAVKSTWFVEPPVPYSLSYFEVRLFTFRRSSRHGIISNKKTHTLTVRAEASLLMFSRRRSMTSSWGDEENCADDQECDLVVCMVEMLCLRCLRLSGYSSMSKVRTSMHYFNCH